MTRRLHALLLLLLGAALAATAGCPQRARHAGADEPELPGLTVERRALEVTLPSGEVAEVGADLVRPTHRSGAVPALVFVPGGGRVSRLGTQPGDGARNYARPVPVTARWVRAVVEAGYLALTFDKRTCAPNDDERCRKNPVSDLDEEGPQALARDVDAACAQLQREEGFDGRVVLFAHGQGVAPTLLSSCAQQAAAVVLVAPIPRGVDEVMVEALRYRERALRKEAKQKAKQPVAEALLQRANQLKNEAASYEAMFASMNNGAFAEDARVRGATLAFWRAWVALTQKTPELLAGVKAPRIVLLGKSDLQYGPKDRRAIRAFAELEGVEVLELDGADHHLLTEEQLEDSTRTALLEALERALEATPPQG